MFLVMWVFFFFISHLIDNLQFLAIGVIRVVDYWHSDCAFINFFKTGSQDSLLVQTFDVLKSLLSQPDEGLV
jgi:hypothetical protein